MGPLKKKPGAGMGDIPAPLARGNKLISFSGGDAVLVQKWGVAKTIFIFEYLAKIFESLSPEEVSQLQGNAYRIGLKLIGLIGTKVTGLMKMLVRKEDEDKITDELPLDDALELVVAAIDLNVSENLLKKVAELKARFGPLLQMAGK